MIKRWNVTKSTELIHVFATIKANSGILLAFFAVKSTATRPLCVLVEKCGHSVNKPFTYLVYLLTYLQTYLLDYFGFSCYRNCYAV